MGANNVIVALLLGHYMLPCMGANNVIVALLLGHYRVLTPQ